MPFKTVTNSAFESLGNAALRFEQNKTVRGITEGLINLIPLVLISSICLAIGNLPIPAIHTFLNGLTMGNWTLISRMIVFSTGDIIGLAALISISFTLAAQSSFIQKREISLFIPTFTAFVCYVILLVWDPVNYNATPAGESPIATFLMPGRNGVLSAIFVAVLSSHLFVVFSKIWQRTSWFHWEVVGSNQQMRIAIRTAVPLLCTLTCFIVFRVLFDLFLETTNIEQNLTIALVELVTEGTLSSVVLSVLLTQVLWFLGAHGSFLFQSAMEQIRAYSTVGTTSGLHASATVQTVDPATMFSNADFFSIFVNMGGAGTTIALLLALLIFGSAGKGKRLARISVFPVAFNINETLLFGVPIVFSPFFLGPFIVVPVLVATISYGAFALGLVPPMIHYVEWTTPTVLSGYLSTGSIAGSVLQVVCIGISLLIYAPFVLSMKNTREKHQLKLFNEFRKQASAAANNLHTSLINRNDDIGEMARDFITEVNTYFEVGQVPFFMVYQPKTDEQGRVAGAEALLRWTHPRFGPIPPDALIELADEAGLSTPLGRWIATQALEELARWKDQGITNTVLSINLNPLHLSLDSEFPDFLGQEMQRLSIDPAFVDLEITEHAAVGASPDMLGIFKRLRDLGVQLSIDDMGIGYSSLTYISNFGVEVVKIDISLADKIDTDKQQREIVRSVIELSRQLQLAVIVEGVEELRQVETLVSLGCRYFQGYYFSKPLVSEDFLAYVADRGMVPLLHEENEKSQSRSH